MQALKGLGLTLVSLVVGGLGVVGLSGLVFLSTSAQAQSVTTAPSRITRSRFARAPSSPPGCSPTLAC